MVEKVAVRGLDADVAPPPTEDGYTENTHVEGADKIYGVAPYVVAGALHYLRVSNPDTYNENSLTISFVKKGIEDFLKQSKKAGAK